MSPQHSYSERVSPEMLATLTRGFSPLQRNAVTQAQMADAIVNHIYRTLRDSQSGKSLSVLVRLFRTCAKGDLAPPLQIKVPAHLHDETRILTLMATRGQHHLWNSVDTSSKHCVIPIDNGSLKQAPMIAHLISVLDPDNPELPDPLTNLAEKDELKLFYVENALTSPLIPAKKDFVIPYGVKSVIGIGGQLNAKDIFTLLIFFNVRIDRETASRFIEWADLMYDLLRPFEEKKLYRR